jgi:hypothetical protein
VLLDCKVRFFFFSFEVFQLKKKRGYHHFLGNRGSISLKKIRIALIFDTGKWPKTMVIATIKSNNSFIFISVFIIYINKYGKVLKNALFSQKKSKYFTLLDLIH